MKYLIPIFCCFTFTLFGQDSVQLVNSFEFNDGVYLTINDLQQNKPNYTWAEINASAHINRDKEVIRLEYLNVKDSSKVGLQEAVWGICVEGVPYIRMIDTMKGQTIFTALRVRGKLCYFYYDSYEMREVPMTIYDPNTGRPIWQQNVENKEPVVVEKMLNFETGNISDMEVSTFKNWIQDDKQLTNTINDLSAAEAREKLYKMLLIYNDRNPYYLVVSD
ncbi:MAG: hypothetical protein ACPG3Z_03035 [Saprospiraceae bacterium]